MSELAGTMPFAERLGIRVESAAADEVRGRLDWAEDLCTAGGILHGGALMALADTVGGLCAFLNMAEGSRTATIESKTNFFRPVGEGRAEAVARPLHVGRRFVVVQTDLLDAEGRRAAQTTQTQAVLEARG